MPKHDTRDGIYQRQDSPVWWCNYSNGRGGTTRRSTGVPIAEDPEGLKARLVRAEWMAGQQVERTGEFATFDDLLELYLLRVSPTKRDPKRDRYSAKNLYPVFTGRRLNDIRGADVRAYIDARTAAGIARATINRELCLMSAACNWGRRELEWEIGNPWSSRRQQEPPGRDRWLTREEAERLLDAADARPARYPWLADFIRLGLYTGMRSGEIMRLEWSRVSFDNAVISFGTTDQKSGKRGQIPANQTAREALARRRQFRATHCPDSPWVMCRHNGERLVELKHGFAECVREAGLDNVHPHDLRRTFGSWLVQAGVGIDRVSVLLRHANISITAKVYAHLRPSDLADASSILDGSSRSFSRKPGTDRATS